MINKLLSFLLVVLFSGCSIYDPWGTVNEEAPLCGPGKSAVAKTREGHPPPLVAATEWTEEGWEVDSRVIQKYDVVKTIEKYLKSVGFFADQRSVDAFSDGIQKCVAESRFFVISLRPTVVIMTPYDFGNPENKSLRELASALSDRHLSSSRLVNGYHYGASIPVEHKYQWFSPNLKTGILNVPKVGDVYEIRGDSVLLKFGKSKTNGWHLIEREM